HPRCRRRRACRGYRPRRRPPSVEARAPDPFADRLLGEAVGRVDVDLGDRVWVLRRDLLDLDATLPGEHPEVLLCRAVEGEGGVVLLLDVAGLLDPDDVDGVALDVHADDVGRVLAGLGLVVGELDAAGLAAPAHLDLRLHDDRVADAVGRGDRGV